VYGETTTGTKADLQQATDIARKMVCEYGMSADLGAVTYGQEEEPLFIGKEIARHKDYSEETAKRIDETMRKILETAKSRATQILMNHRAELDKLTEELLQKETLDDAEIRILLGMAPAHKYESETKVVVEEGGV
jgi:cell division protease FtsH